MIKNNFNLKIKFLFLMVVFIFLSVPAITFADTHVYSNDVRPGWTWDKAGSPYILEDSIYIPHDGSLYIKGGVEVVSAVLDSGDTNTITIDGKLDIIGIKVDPVKITNLYSIYLSNSNSTINNAIFDGTGIEFEKSSSTISNTVIKNTITAISAKASHIDISSSTINNNSYGITSSPWQRIFQVNSKIPNTGGIGNALVGILDENIDYNQNIISIHNSSIDDNNYGGIINQISNTIDATNNWWGRKEGPNVYDALGSVNTRPWLDFDPNKIEEKPTCCSNILFIPGFEASRLYVDESGILGTTTNKLWEPNRNGDVRKLYLDSNGRSVDKSIYTKDILKMATGVGFVYKTFSDSMDDLVKKDTIKEWRSAPYDWRKNPDEIVDSAFIDNILNLASSSITGKVTIVAHSNGGLITKALMKKLESLGTDDFVGHVIFVAVPELGTPEAIFGLTNGYNQSLLGGMILSKDNARNFSLNMPGAYGLLPTKKFFENNPITVVTSDIGDNKIISSFESLKKFLLSNSYSATSSKDTNIPLLLNPNLLSKSESFHLFADSWKPSTSTDRVSIFGWGVPTSSNITYSNTPHCNSSIGSCKIEPSVNFDKGGDGTVLTKSNSKNADTTLFFNINAFSKREVKDISHVNILEADAVISKILEIVTGIKKEKDNYNDYFSSTEPVDNDITLTIRVYSPVDIDVYDSQGHHTGQIYNPDLGGYTPDWQNSIPGSIYNNFSQKVVVVPYSDDLQVVLSGNDSGVFAVKADISKANVILASTTFADLPATPLMNIDFAIGSSSESFVSNTYMNIDVDGDGITDLIGRSNEFLQSTSTDIVKDIPTYLEYIKKVIISLGLPTHEEKSWLDRIDRISKMIGNKNYKKVEKITKKLLGKRFKDKKINSDQRTAILTTFENLLSSLEKTNKTKKID